MFSQHKNKENRVHPVQPVKSTALVWPVTIAKMSQESNEQSRSELVVHRGERGRFAAGGPSANPNGRPRRGETRAEQTRRNGDWNAFDSRMAQIILNPKSKDSDAIAAYRELNDRAWGKPLSSHELHVTRSTDDGERAFADLSDEEIARRLALLRGELPGGADVGVYPASATTISDTCENPGPSQSLQPTSNQALRGHE